MMLANAKENAHRAFEKLWIKTPGGGWWPDTGGEIEYFSCYHSIASVTCE